MSTAGPAAGGGTASRLLATPPPGPFRQSSWRSPLRGPWLTSVLGAVLYVGIPVLVVTGLLSFAAYAPGLPGNNATPESDWLVAVTPSWPSSPTWLYRLTQGTHMLLGLALVPVLLAKLWSVIPRLFAWPPVSSPAQALERLTVALLVGGGLVTFATGVINIQIWYPLPFSFYRVHFFASLLFLGGFLAHVALKTPVLVRTLRERGLREELAVGRAETRPEPPVGEDAEGLAPTDPDEATVSRRGALGLVGASSLVVLGLSAGQVASDNTIRATALLAPRGAVPGSGPQAFPVNKTAAAVGIDEQQTGSGWRLVVRAGAREVSLTRPQLLAMPQHTYDLPISCVEGWSTSQTWTGVRLSELAALVGVTGPTAVDAQSLQESGQFRSAVLSSGQVGNDKSLLALKVNGADLSLDHGYPARVMVPAAPGVHNTKWISMLDVRPDLA